MFHVSCLNYGMAQCGPDGTLLSGDPEERVPIASQLIKFPAEDAFLVRAKGDSMQPKINEGDLVIARKSITADKGNIIVCALDGKVLIKKFHSDGNQIILQSGNKDQNKYPPILAKNKKVKIEGIVKGVIQYS